TPVMAAVRPGRSSPVILIRTISRKAQLPWQRRRAFYNSPEPVAVSRAAAPQSAAVRQESLADLQPPLRFPYTAALSMTRRAALCEPARIPQARQFLPADLPCPAAASYPAGAASGRAYAAAAGAGAD